MELSEVWTCGNCQAQNTSDVFSDPCWKCGMGGSDKPVAIETDPTMCPDCKATDGYHKLDCPTHPLPKDWIKKP